MIKDFKIFENVNNYDLYHFTDMFSIMKILKDGFINPSYDGGLNDGEEYGISTTRYKSLKWMNNNIRITFDKRKIQHNYKIKPIHWFNMRHYWDNSDDYRKYGTEKKPYTNQNIPANQYEERILTDKPLPIKYIKEITVTNEFYYKKIKKYTNIPIYYDKRF
jgi:hypothetical protein